MGLNKIIRLAQLVQPHQYILVTVDHWDEDVLNCQPNTLLSPHFSSILFLVDLMQKLRSHRQTFPQQ